MNRVNNEPGFFINNAAKNISKNIKIDYLPLKKDTVLYFFSFFHCSTAQQKRTQNKLKSS